MRLVLLGEALAYLMELNIWVGDGDLWVSRLFHLQEIRIVVGINANIFQACTGIIHLQQLFKVDCNIISKAIQLGNGGLNSNPGLSEQNLGPRFTASPQNQ